MYAATDAGIETVRVLLQTGADPKLRDRRDKTALDYAQEGNYAKAAALLTE